MEYLSGIFEEYLDSKGIQLKLTTHHTPEKDGISERLNCTFMEKVRAMLIASGLPIFLWGEALFHACYLKNRTSTKALNGHTPFEAVTGKVPDLRNLPEWGCLVWVHDRSTGKLGVWAKKGYWVGFYHQTNGHHIYWPKKRTVRVEHSVVFSETHVPVPHDADDVELEGEENDNESEAESNPDIPIIPGDPKVVMNAPNLPNEPNPVPPAAPVANEGPCRLNRNRKPS